VKALLETIFCFVLGLLARAFGAAIFFIPLAVGLESLRTPFHFAAALFVLSLFSFLRPLTLIAFAGGWGVSLWLFFEAFYRAMIKPHTIIGYFGTVFIGVTVTALLLFALFLSFNLLLFKTGRGDNPLADPAEDKEGDSKEEACTKQFDPYGILSLDPGASKEEIRKKYRLMMQQYHPDKVEHLGADLRALAKEKTIEIKRAYEMIGC
jgi:hypothetical protein